MATMLVTSLALASGTDEQLANWVPAQLLAAALVFVCGLLYLLIRKVVHDFTTAQEKRDEAQEKKDEAVAVKLDAISKGLTDLDKRFVSAASLEQLSRMGDRFDARITGVEREQAVLKDRMERK